MKRWLLKRTNVKTKEMAQAMGIREATACVMANRGIGTYIGAKNFLETGAFPVNLPDTSKMKDFIKGMELLERALQEKKKIAVYGDYDVDGVMSTAIIYKTIKICGGDVMYYLPHRQKQGYGLNGSAVEELSQQGVQLLFTCDNGIAAIEEVRLAKRLGMEVLILDHHEPGFEKKENEVLDILPCADALIDPKQQACQYPFLQLCAGGLAYRFATEFLKRMKLWTIEQEREFIVLASIATVCDIVDLAEDNRVIAKAGLTQVKKSGNPGLDILLKETGLMDKGISEYHFGFVLGPCINACGRLESAEKAVALLCGTDKEELTILAKQLIQLNESRKYMTAVVAEKAVNEVETSTLREDKVLVVYQEDAHESIAGIAASRLKEYFNRPVLMITKGEEEAKGSGRSIEGYHMFQELSACKDLFTRFGGHAMAAGFSLPIENIDILREQLNRSCTLTPEQLQPVLRLDKQLSFAEIDLGLARELCRLAPFGKGNASPLFGSKNINILRFSLMGKNKDMLRFQMHEPSSGITMTGVCFNGFTEFKNIIIQLYGAENCDNILAAGKIDKPFDFVYSIDINFYQGIENVKLTIRDFRLSNESI